MTFSAVSTEVSSAVESKSHQNDLLEALHPLQQGQYHVQRERRQHYTLSAAGQDMASGNNWWDKYLTAKIPFVTGGRTAHALCAVEGAMVLGGSGSPLSQPAIAVPHGAASSWHPASFPPTAKPHTSCVDSLVLEGSFPYSVKFTKKVDAFQN